MKREVREKRNKLLINSKGLAESLLDCNEKEKVIVLQEQQDRAYKKWKFYDKVIKAMEKDNERKDKE